MHILLLGLMLLLSGCQASRLFEKEVVVDNATFMSLWAVYDHCHSSHDLGAMTADTHRLVYAVQNTPSIQDFAPLPKLVGRFVSEPVNRLAVDLKTMTAACQLYTGQLALTVDRNDIAADMFQAIIREYREPAYTYYVTQAKTGMQQVVGRSQFARAEIAPSGRRLTASSAADSLSGVPSSPSDIQAYP